ncbi:MAG: MFS transporter [Patescibacteria group bacterium]|nr:MFS transporter [Patescibacteria group bacterium]
MDIIKKIVGSNDIVKVLRIKPFLNLMLSEFFSQTAFNMQHFVIIFIIYEVFKSNTAVSGVILSFTIPSIIFSVLAGVYVDRWDKKRVLFYTNFLRALLLLFFLIPNLHLAAIYTITFLLAVATQFFLPAEAPMIPNLVKKELMVSANAIFGAGIFVTVLIGYIISGPLLLILGRSYIFILLSFLFFTSAIFILFIPSSKKVKAVQNLASGVSDSIIFEIKEVFAFMRKTKKVTTSLILLTFSQTILFVFAVLGPGYMSQILNVQVESLSWILLAPAALGMIVGSVTMGSLSRKISLHTAITIGFLLEGLVFIFLPHGSRVESYRIVQVFNEHLPHYLEINILHIIMFSAFLAGLGNSLIFVPANTTIQTHTTEEFRGRVYGLLNALVGAVSLIPVAAAGGLADILGIGTVLGGMGFLLFITGIIRFFF